MFKRTVKGNTIGNWFPIWTTKTFATNDLRKKMKASANDMFAALVTAIGYQTDNERKLEMEKSHFLQNIEKMLDAVKRGEQLELVYPNDLNELG